jgi:putative restriction endonuclease
MNSFAITTEQRLAVFKQLAPFFGRIVPAKFIQKTIEVIKGIDRIHNLVEGIYKPKDSQYALTIASMLVNPYADRLEFNSDRSWYFSYSPKIGRLDGAVNLSLFSCMRDNEPVLVIQQVSDKTSVLGARYRILGLGIIETFDEADQLFRVREVTIDNFQQRLDPTQILQDDLIETAIQLEALEKWAPFVAENRAVYQVSKQKRDDAFRKVVLANYSNTCAVTGSRFVFNKAVEAQAAHIVSKEKNGTDDPRNGLALSQTAHWAFDQGLFAISDQFEIQVHPSTRNADFSRFPVLEKQNQVILLPDDEMYYPHVEALKWHEKHVYGKFRA